MITYYVNSAQIILSDEKIGPIVELTRDNIFLADFLFKKNKYITMGNVKGTNIEPFCKV